MRLTYATINQSSNNTIPYTFSQHNGGGMSRIYSFAFFGVIINLLDSARLLCSNPIEDGHDLDSLVLIHVLFRHGHRTPDTLEVYPKDPYANLTYYPTGYGELTNEGKRREYLIGKALRKRYDRFLDIYTPDVLLARTTDYNRTKASCELVLAGLYPPAREQLWDNELNWQPIPFNYENYNQDHVLGDPRFNCPNYEKLYKDYLGSLKGLILYNENKVLYNYLSKHTGWNVTTPKDVYNLYFVLKSEESMGFELPQWTNKVWPKNITDVAVEEYHVDTATTRMRRLAGGFLLKKIMDDTKAKIKGTLVPTNRKIFLYSAHENNIAYLLILLNVFYPHVPPFGAYVTLEVHHIQGVYGFKILYQDYSRKQGPKLLTLPGCNSFCAIDKFTKLVDEYFPTSKDVCGNEGEC